MTDIAYVFPPPPVASLPVRDAQARFPVRRIFCVGRNYAAHAAEMGVTVDRKHNEPFFFTKTPVGALAESGATIPYPPGTQDFHYEMELVVALGADAFRVAEAEAWDPVWGYACGLDMTRRDLQQASRERKHPWDLGKDVDRSAVVSEIVPAGAVGRPTCGEIALRVNDAVKQRADLGDLIWSVPELIAHLSRYYRLQPGDLIFTGTPAGVGPVVPGDRLAGSIEGVGSIEIRIGEPA
ncbi:MAG: fumarylacetoacetate hydrolase family protein [Betaproteobacteria bacterium]|nr:fumarylacetoacetate hydrolase family protein [Betaproteobacteria bacterium]